MAKKISAEALRLGQRVKVNLGDLGTLRGNIVKLLPQTERVRVEFDDGDKLLLSAVIVEPAYRRRTTA